jgi:hypothetical protein
MTLGQFMNFFLFEMEQIESYSTASKKANHIPLSKATIDLSSILQILSLYFRTFKYAL